ncbi:MAG: 3-hydroxyisobutyrate dehydrogenase [Solirubrobacteraceae bacterium]|nr:3-hydroxyisobutyrate dehydrogenase [Solirubrobacteraceae bacterium]
MARVGFIGLGIMGSRMAANLRRAGVELTVFNRTRRRAEEWAVEHGATVADSPAEVGRAADVVITMVVDGPQVEAMLLGPAGVVEGAAPGTLCVDMSTIAPADTRRIGAALAEREIAFVDAPVTGSSPRAQDGTLTIMAGGTTADFERARALFDVMGKLVVHVGELGQGQTVKLINNAVAATNLSTLAQALIVGRATGVDLDALMTIMGAGSGGSAMLDLKGQPLVDHDYSTLFKLEHMLQDVRLCLEEGQAAGVPFPAAAHTREVLTAGMGRGLGDADFAAMLDVLEALADTRL